MNLREFIQSEILNALSEDYDLDQAFNDAEPVDDSVNEMDVNDPILVKIRAAQMKRNKDAAKKIEKQKKINPDYKALKNAPKIKALKKKRAEIMRDMEQEAEPEGGKIADRYGKLLNKIDNDIIKLGGNPMSESVNEAKKGEFEMGDFVHFKSANKTGMVKKISGDKITIRTMKGDFTGDIKDIKILHQDNVNEEQIDEKLITFSNRAPYGQIVFMAGGAASGKGFAISNFIDSAGFKVRDVDEMKTALAKLNELGKFSVDKWYEKFGNNLSEKNKAHIEEFVIGKGLSISDIANPQHELGGLKNPNNVMSLHLIVDAMGLKDKWLINMLKGKSNKETLPNLLFDITAKKVKSITSVIKPLVDAGYDANNIHLIWVLTNYHLSVKQNKKRDRVVPDDVLLLTHEGAAKTIWSILTGGLPKGLNGRIDVILNNRENTVMFKDSKGNEMEGAVKGFKSLPVKKQGGGIMPEKVWKKILYGWISDNGPKTVDLRKPLDRQMGK